MRRLILVVALASLAGCLPHEPSPPKRRVIEIPTWNEVPLHLYGTDRTIGGWMRGLIWEKASGRPADCDLGWYLQMSQDLPKLREFMTYAAKSSNGFDEADCWAMLDIVEDDSDAYRAEQKRKEEARVVATLEDKS